MTKLGKKLIAAAKEGVAIARRTPASVPVRRGQLNSRCSAGFAPAEFIRLRHLGITTSRAMVTVRRTHVGLSVPCRREVRPLRL